jgi:hypothetical protein
MDALARQLHRLGMRGQRKAKDEPRSRTIKPAHQSLINRRLSPPLPAVPSPTTFALAIADYLAGIWKMDMRITPDSLDSIKTLGSTLRQG